LEVLCGTTRTLSFGASIPLDTL